MPISMSRSARYVTQSGLFDCPVLGPLTDRKIRKYQKLGKLPWPDKPDERPKRRTKKEVKPSVRKTLLADYV